MPGTLRAFHFSIEENVISVAGAAKCIHSAWHSESTANYWPAWAPLDMRCEFPPQTSARKTAPSCVGPRNYLRPSLPPTAPAVLGSYLTGLGHSNSD